MRALIFVLIFALIAAAATPAEAQRTLPMPPRGVDYVEASCAGGIVLIDETVRILADGQIIRTSPQGGGVLRARATPAEVMRIWRKLDMARFERRVVRRAPAVPDGIDCTLSRQQRGSLHSVSIPQVSRNDAAIADLRSVLADIRALGRRATGPIMRPAARQPFSVMPGS